MPPPKHRSTPSKSKLLAVEDHPIFKDLSNSSNYDANLARRFATVLGLKDSVVASNSTIGRRNDTQLIEDVGTKQKLAMTAANTISQILSVVTKSGWKAGEPNKSSQFTLEQVLSLAASYRVALHSLRQTMPQSLDLERAASTFVTKLTNLHLYELALDFLEEFKPYLMGHYYELSDDPVPKKIFIHQPKLPSLSRFSQLLQYPLSPLTDETLLSIIPTSIAQALACLTALLARGPVSEAASELLLSALEHDHSVLGWQQLLPDGQRDSLLSRVHRSIAISFSTSNTPPSFLFQLRTFALRCLLLRSSLEYDAFWTQAMQYLNSYAKTMKEKRLFDDCLQSFELLVSSAQRRSNGNSFTCPSFHKFCETTLVLLQRSDDSDHMRRVAVLINSDAIGTDVSSEEASRVQLLSLLSQCVKAFAKFLETGEESTLLPILPQCIEFLKTSSAIFREVMSNVALLRPLEALRRSCGKALDEDKPCSPELHKYIINFLEAFVNDVEQAVYKWDATIDLAACAVDTLCSLSNVGFSPLQLEAQQIAFDHLFRGVKLATRNWKGEVDSFTLIKVLRRLGTAFWSKAAVLYQKDNYGTAVRFLVQACELSSMACTMAKGSSIPPDYQDSMRVLETHVPQRWEVLADCYYKIGERENALKTFVESIKSYPMDQLSVDAVSIHPHRLKDDSHYSRLKRLVQRATHLAVFDLFKDSKSSLYILLSPSEIPAEVLGLLVEWQIAYFDEMLTKPQVQAILSQLIKEALLLYEPNVFPIRRARVLLQQLLFSYRTDNLIANTDAISAEILHLMRLGVLGKDEKLLYLKRQYESATHILLAFHFYLHSSAMDNAEATIIQASAATKILDDFIPRLTVASSARQSPKASPPSNQRRATRLSPGKNTNIVRGLPITPKPRQRRSLAISPLSNAVSPRGEFSPSVSAPSLPKIDPWIERLVGMFAQLMGILGNHPLRIQLLGILQRMASLSDKPSTDNFISASVDAAVEYMQLGKMRRALAIYTYALPALQTSHVSLDIKVTFLLRYAETLGINGQVAKSVQTYEEARQIADTIKYATEKSLVGQIRVKVRTIERSARAAKTMAVIHMAKDDTAACLVALKRSLKLWNRAFENLARLLPNKFEETNPFDMQALEAALPKTNTNPPQEMPANVPPLATDDLHWRIAEGLLYGLIDLSELYFRLGSVRSSEYFMGNAQALALSLNSPVFASRATAKLAEIQLHRGDIDKALSNIGTAEALVEKIPGLEAADILRLSARQKELLINHVEASRLNQKAITVLSEFESVLSTVDNDFVTGLRRSSLGSPGQAKIPIPEPIAPDLIAKLLARIVWLQRDNPNSSVLEKLASLQLPKPAEIERLDANAKLALHNAYSQFRSDIFLSSLSESTIAIPMGLSTRDSKRRSIGSKRILETLADAQSKFANNLKHALALGHVLRARDAATSLAMIKLFQVYLGVQAASDASVAPRLLDGSAALTLQHELIETVDLKFPKSQEDDLAWASFNDQSFQNPRNLLRLEDNDLKDYWESIRARYCKSVLWEDEASNPINALPHNWTVVTISLTDDKTALLLSRQRPQKKPILFCIPFDRRGRKDENDEEQTFNFNFALEEFHSILAAGDETAKTAKDVPNEKEAKKAWWARRVTLDNRMRDFLDHVEFCWLGAFKTILHQPAEIPKKTLDTLRNRVTAVFCRALPLEKKQLSKLKLDDSLVHCIAALPPKCRFEELEDFAYFLLDLYQFYGVNVSVSDIDMDVLVAELRTILEDHVLRRKADEVQVEDAHTFLVLDKNVQGLPWESIPFLRGKSVSRIPSASFLVDRIEMAKVERKRRGMPYMEINRAVVNPKSTFYIVNPAQDLKRSQERFTPWLEQMERRPIGWKGVRGHAPTHMELMEALEKKDLFIYIGHGGAEQYMSSRRLRQLPRCAATMLWGCSSGLMKNMGDFDRVGTPYNYMLAGCPTLISCLWDVTDNDLDKFSQSVFEKLRLDAKNVESWVDGQEGAVSVVAAVAQSREVCKLKYLTGAAPVVYGIPFYL